MKRYWSTLLSSFLVALIYEQQQAIAQSFNQDEHINIYCISNQDGTGECSDTKTGEPFICTLIPGQVIACRDKDQKKFSCINYGSNQSYQGYFQCTPKAALSIDNTIPPKP